jgi:hypothetical protein
MLGVLQLFDDDDDATIVFPYLHELDCPSDQWIDSRHFDSIHVAKL